MRYIAVCDDDPVAIKTILKHLESLRSHGFFYEVTPYQNGEDLISDHEKGHRFHMILLDMIMKPKNGIKVAEGIRAYDALVPILIITSTTEYAVEGYKINAQRYLLKPIDHDELMKAAIPLLQESINREERFFTFSQDGAAVRVRLDQILYFESDLKLVHLVTRQEEYTFPHTLSQIESDLAKEGFERVHKSFVVNLRYVNRLNAQSLTLDNQQELPVSKHRYKDILRRIMQFESGNRQEGQQP